MKTLFSFIGYKDSKEDQEFHSHNEITQPIDRVSNKHKHKIRSTQERSNLLFVGFIQS